MYQTMNVYVPPIGPRQGPYSLGGPVNLVRLVFTGDRK